jgi:cysteine synthase
MAGQGPDDHLRVPRPGGSGKAATPVALSRPDLRNSLYPFSPGATQMAKFANILETVGNTPVVKVGKLAPAGIDLYVKIEAFNPLGSVKDRLALGVIEDAERRGTLKPGQTVIEATSGNTGIGLAMVCAQKGYPLVVTMAESFSMERRKLMRFLGAKVVLTPAPAGGTGMVNKAVELAETHGWFLTRQFENEANADYHSRTTAREIVNDFAGGRLDYWVTGFGTGGTLKGVARVLAKERPETRIVLAEPADAPIVSSGTPQQRNPDGSPSARHPAWKPHPIQGWSPDFLPKLAGDAVEAKQVHRVITVPTPEAMKWSRQLAAKEGIFVGVSAGGTFAAAMEVAAGAEKGSTILCMLPDTGERYLTTPLFAEIPVDMTPEEVEILKSTPTFAEPAAPAAQPAAAAPAAR